MMGNKRHKPEENFSEHTLRKRLSTPKFSADAHTVFPAGIPILVGATGNADHRQGLRNRQMRCLNSADELNLFRGRVSHSSTTPSPIMLFEQTVLKGQFGNNFFQGQCY